MSDKAPGEHAVTLALLYTVNEGRKPPALPSPAFDLSIAKKCFMLENMSPNTILNLFTLAYITSLSADKTSGILEGSN